MRTEGQRRSDNFEDRGRGSGGMGGGGLPGGVLFAILRRIGLRGIVIAGIVLAGIWFFAPPNIKQMVFGALLGQVPGQTQTTGEGSVCDSQAAACDFSRTILASTEDVWAQQFAQGRLPNYGRQPGAYENPTLAVFADPATAYLTGADAERRLEALQPSMLLRLPGGHHLHLEDPAPVAAAIAAFLLE